MITWFPSLSPDGQRVLGESGTGWVVLDGQPLVRGYGPPVWIDGTAYLYASDDPRGTFKRSLDAAFGVRVHPEPLIELAACPTLWAGRDPHRNVLVLSDGREIPNAGQPAISAEGHLIYRTGDDRIEPSISREVMAWGDGAGHIIGRFRFSNNVDLTVAGPEYRPRCVDTPDGPWLLTMTHTALRLRPFGASDGFVLETSDNGNLNSHVVCVGRELRVVYQDARGHVGRWHQPIDAPRQPFAVPTPGTPVPIPGTPGTPMPTPNHIAVVQAVRASYPTPLGTQHAAFLLELASRLPDGAGLLRKSGGTVVTLPDDTTVAQDIICYPDGRIFDVLSDGEGAAMPTWAEANGSPVDPSRYYRVSAAQPAPPADNPPVPDHSDELKLLWAAVSELRRQNDRIYSRISNLETLTYALRQHIEQLEARTYRVVISRTWGHSHSGTVEVVE